MNDYLAAKLGKLVSSEVKFLEYLQPLKENGITICDIGGGIGEFSHLCFKMLGADIKQILIFEPSPSNRNRIRPHRNLKIIKEGIYYGKTETQLVGMGDDNIFGEMLKASSEEFSIQYKEILHEGETVPLTTLEDHIFPPENLWLAKIDVEGSEYNIIKNSEIIKEFKFLMVEWHSRDYDYVNKFIEKHLPQYDILMDDKPENHMLLKLKR